MPGIVNVTLLGAGYFLLAPAILEILSSIPGPYMSLSVQIPLFLEGDQPVQSPPDGVCHCHAVNVPSKFNATVH
jgi:hypothetical protein